MYCSLDWNNREARVDQYEQRFALEEQKWWEDPDKVQLHVGLSTDLKGFSAKPPTTKTPK